MGPRLPKMMNLQQKVRYVESTNSKPVVYCYYRNYGVLSKFVKTIMHVPSVVCSYYHKGIEFITTFFIKTRCCMLHRLTAGLEYMQKFSFSNKHHATTLVYFTTRFLPFVTLNYIKIIRYYFLPRKSCNIVHFISNSIYKYIIVD